VVRAAAKRRHSAVIPKRVMCFHRQWNALTTLVQRIQPCCFFRTCRFFDLGLHPDCNAIKRLCLASGLSRLTEPGSIHRSSTHTPVGVAWVRAIKNTVSCLPAPAFASALLPSPGCFGRQAVLQSPVDYSCHEPCRKSLHRSLAGSISERRLPGREYSNISKTQTTPTGLYQLPGAQMAHCQLGWALPSVSLLALEAPSLRSAVTASNVERTSSSSKFAVNSAWVSHPVQRLCSAEGTHQVFCTSRGCAVPGARQRTPSVTCRVVSSLVDPPY